MRVGDRLCVPDVDGLRQRILQEAHNAPYSVHPGVTKMYQDVKGMYWWNGIKKDVAQYVASCLTCQQVKFEHQGPDSCHGRVSGINKICIPKFLLLP